MAQRLQLWLVALALLSIALATSGRRLPSALAQDRPDANPQGYNPYFPLRQRARLGPPTAVADPSDQPIPQSWQTSSDAPPTLFTPPTAEPLDKLLPINLPAALKLANARPLDVALASERIQVALAQLERAKVLWLPTIYLGADYYRHDGQLQDVAGNIFGTSKSSVLIGAGPSAVFAVTDAIFEPLVARQVLRARRADWEAAQNDTARAVAEAYFDVQQARGELAGADDAAKRTEDLVRRTSQLAKGFVAPVDLVRAKAELAERRQAAMQARQRWQTASAELARILRLEPTALVEPLEPPHLQVTLVPLDQPVDALIPIALTRRPELASQQALVQASLQRLKAERLRPLIPSLLLRGASTNPAGTLAGGAFGGGIDGRIGDFAARGDFDVQVLWELQNLGLGNWAKVKEKRAENQAAIVELFRTQDRIAAEVARAYAEAKSAQERIRFAAGGVQDAVDSVNKHFAGFEQPQKVGNILTLVIRPQEVVAAIQTLARAYNNYYGAVADYDRAQFRLYRALGQPGADVLPRGEKAS